MPGYRETELLIREIKNRPVIWDTSVEDYKDKGKRAIAWREICCRVEENFGERSSQEQTRLVKELQARWKSIRDSYMKDCKRHSFRRRSSAGILKPRRYVFADLLTFLRKDLSDFSRETSISRPTSTITSIIPPDTYELTSKHQQQTQDECCSATTTTAMTTTTVDPVTTADVLKAEDLEPMELSPEPPFKRTRCVKNETERNHEPARDNDYFCNCHEDSDRDFFMGLLPIVKRLDEDQKLDFKAQVLLALRNVKVSGGNVDRQVAPTMSNSSATNTRSTFSTISNQMTPTPQTTVSCPHYHQVFPTVYTSLPPYSFVHFGL